MPHHHTSGRRVIGRAVVPIVLMFAISGLVVADQTGWLRRANSHEASPSGARAGTRGADLPPVGVPAPTVLDRGVATILAAFREQRSEVVVQCRGVVTAILPDDLDGARHQVWRVRIDPSHSVMVLHNIDIGQRVPVAESEPIEFRGRYEWSRDGGIVFGTARADSDELSGWVRHQGACYR